MKKLSMFFSCGCFLTLFLFSVSAFAQDDLIRSAQISESFERNLAITKALDKYKVKDAKNKAALKSAKKEKKEKKQKNLSEESERDKIIELAVKYAFALHGEQSFEIAVDGYKISKLRYPHKSQMLFYEGELHLSSRFSVGGKYGSSLFKKSTGVDSDWYYDGAIYVPYTMLESNFKNKAEVEAYDFNLFYRLIDFNKESQKAPSIFSDDISNFIGSDIDRFSFDIFAGYQQQRGRYGMTEGVWKIIFWTPVDQPFDGLDSFYKVTYQGPRAGIRAHGSLNRFVTNLSFAFAWLKTKAYGWWNLRDYKFEQNGTDGFGFDFEVDLGYKFTPHILGGLGFAYIACKQKEAKESGAQPGDIYDNLDIVRNINSTIYAPFVFIKGIW